MNTTVTSNLPKTNFSKRLIAAAAVIGLAATGALIARNASAPSAVITESKPIAIAQRVDVCSSARPAGVWFPVQVEMQFAAQCGTGVFIAQDANTLNQRHICTMSQAERGWLPPQVEMQFAQWCK